MKEPTTKTCPCQFPNREAERQSRRAFLSTYGDDLPELVIDEIVGDQLWEGWVVKCDCERPDDIVAAGHWKQNDWYLCTLRGVAVAEQWRGKGLGRQTVSELTEKASNDPQCLVLAADITYDNLPSIRAFRRAGFETVGEFCWGKGQPPANILHFARFKPTQDKRCLAPEL